MLFLPIYVLITVSSAHQYCKSLAEISHKSYTYLHFIIMICQRCLVVCIYLGCFGHYMEDYIPVSFLTHDTIWLSEYQILSIYSTQPSYVGGSAHLPEMACF